MGNTQDVASVLFFIGGYMAGGLLGEFIRREGLHAMQSPVGSSGQEGALRRLARQQANEPRKFQRKEKPKLSYFIDKNTSRIMKQQGDTSSAFSLDDFTQLSQNEQLKAAESLGFGDGFGGYDRERFVNKLKGR